MPIDKAILKDSTADSVLLEKGYAIIPFLNPEEVIELSQFFYQSHEAVPEGLYATAHVQDVDFRNKMNDKINKVLSRASESSFINVQSLGGTFMVKTPGEKGLLYPHQDWNIVDEDEWRSFNVWIPLVDVNPKNGTLQVLEESHLSGKTYRGINIPQMPFDDKDNGWSKMTSATMKAGEALIYDHRLWHASQENTTKEHRLVVVYGVIPKGAEMRYYYQEGDLIGEYACHPEFFLSGNPGGGPKGLKKIQDIQLTNTKSPQDTSTTNPKSNNKSIFDKFKSWLSI